jgi:predicted HicB family RNase H-like nuclease
MMACFTVRLEGIEDIITFEAGNVRDLETEFRISIDEYLGWCAEDGIEPNRPSPTETTSVPSDHRN